MASINYAAREINVKIVYYGPGLSGKTTNLQVIHRKVPPEFKSDMVSLATETDRTLFFDFLPLDLGKIKGFATKFQLYTVPGQVYYNATRKLVLRGVDGIVFVADSGQDKIEENLESFQNLEDNLAEYGYKRESIPIIIQYNKRDLPNALPVEELQQYVNKYNLPYGEAVANKGTGVFGSLKLIGKIVIDYLNKKYSRGGSRGAARPAPQAAAPRRPAPPPPPRQAPPMPPPQRSPQQAPSPQFNQLGGQPPAPPRQQQRPPFQGGQPSPGYPPQMRQAPAGQPPMPPPRAPAAPQQQMPTYPPQQSSAPADQGFQMDSMATRGRTSAPPQPQTNQQYEEDHALFEPPPQQQQQQNAAPAGQQDEYYSYGSINLEPMDQQGSAPAAPQQGQYPSGGDYAQQPPAPQRDEYNVSGKTDLDMEIERYQREIEEKQKRMRTTGGAAQPQSPAPATQQQPQMPPPQQQQQAPAPGTAANLQNDYDVYNMDMQSYDAPQPRPQQQQQQQPSMGGNDDEEMFFTSVDTDRHKKPVRRPVNPRMQQQKGFLSKFFNKDMPQ